MNKKQTIPVLKYNSNSITEAPRELYSQHKRLKIMGYLRNADFLQISSFSQTVYDEFTGEEMPASGSRLSDGKWHWNDDLWLYVRDYDIQLPEEFIRDIENFYQQGKRPQAIPYKGAITLYESGDDEFAKHYKGRKSNYLWNDSSLQVQIQEVDCTVDFELQHLQFSMAERQAFFPIFVYVEDCTRNNSVYLKETYRLYIDGAITLDEKNESIPQTVSNLFFEFLCHSNLKNKIDEFMKKENTAIIGLPLADKDICYDRKGEIICLPQ